MNAVDVSDPAVSDSPQEPEETPVGSSRLLRRHRRLRILVWLLVAAALLAGFGVGVAIGSRPARDMVRVDSAGVPVVCREAIGQADVVARKGFAVNRAVRQYLTISDEYAAGRLDGHQALQRTAALGKRAQADSEEFSASLPPWRIARSYCPTR